jgi:hypothetical protein
MIESLFRQLNSESNIQGPVAVAAVSCSLALGVAADVLFNGAALGLNVPLWSFAAVGSLALLRQFAGPRVAVTRLLLCALAAALTLAVAWRASAALSSCTWERRSPWRLSP